ncbi:hypothetical protein EV702DRAFT_1203278 [Suillus placidus]|uniref:Ubiquitin-like protease family profile domain-containing protein n=1 Tax=Suillus placidus TaxID=48579 RepID=A0A9P7CWI6_9AGAM|nr:hypothetical protein EV702DRAFT_1203278 [Suillus placidus]
MEMNVIGKAPQHIAMHPLLELPKDALARILPQKSLSVLEFLSFKLPAIMVTTKHVTIEAFFSKDQPSLGDAQLIQDLPIHSTQSGTLNGFAVVEPVVKLAVYATDDWLFDVHENQMLDLLRRRIQRQPQSQKIEIENIYFYGFLKKAYEIHSSGEHEGRYFAHARETGDAMALGLGSCIGFLVNINENHWVAVVIDFESSTIFYGDSIYTKLPTGFLAVLHWWTHHHTGQHFEEKSLIITHRKDSFSCGLLSFNALAHHVLPSEYPLIMALQVRIGRLNVMLDVIDRHLNQNSALAGKVDLPIPTTNN